MQDLTQGSVIRHLLNMAAFMAVSMLMQTLYLLADLYWVGRLGKEAIAAVGVAGNWMMVVLALAQALGVGTTTLIAQATGRKDQPKAERVFNQSLAMSVIIGLFFLGAGFLVRGLDCRGLSADVATAGSRPITSAGSSPRSRCNSRSSPSVLLCARPARSNLQSEFRS